ncbi:MAG TPA: D-alanyl-D-alanine carboxypeptidase/D-alanyl-D-alanine-endopeptidase [Thermoleophilia bacterium]|nr:D-alanyl-D-alanine carboxypeptidase/D-alanyl-D-alanine-endopeptidase [Thermoleophilia bacterium]
MPARRSSEISNNRRFPSRALAVIAGLLLALLLLAPAAASASVGSQVASILSRHGLAGSGTSVGMYDLTGKRPLYDLRWDVLRLPASNEKLVTSAAALADWSAAHHFSTELYGPVAAPDAAGVLDGDLYLKGFGDPSLKTAGLGVFVAKLQSFGITKITGRVLADDGYFDALRTAPSWRPGMVAYCGPLSALTLNEGFGPGGRYVADPAVWAAGTLTKLLRAAGIKVVHAAARGVVLADATRLGTESSAALAHLLARMNKESDDFYAEELLKGLGASFWGAGTTAAGATVAVQGLNALGVTDGFRIRDGSGLSYQDKLSAHAIVKLLGAMSRRADFATFLGSLSIAGKDGTLGDRMKGTRAAGNVHGKTGTLAAASCLSGYVTSANGHLLAFSILMNGSGLSQTKAHDAQDEISEALAAAAP